MLAVDEPLAPEFDLNDMERSENLFNEVGRSTYRFRCDWLSSDSDLFRFRSSINDKAGLALGELG